MSGLVLVGSFSEARYDPFYRLEGRRLGKRITEDNASDWGGLGGFEGLRDRLPLIWWLVYCALWVRGRPSRATGTETDRSLSGLLTLPARTITSTFTCCGAGGVATSTGQTAPISSSASAPVIRAALRDSPSNSLEDSFRRNLSLGAAE